MARTAVTSGTDQSQLTSNTESAVGKTVTNQKVAQTFTPTQARLKSVTLKFRRTNTAWSSPDNLVVKIVDTVAGVPSTNVFATVTKAKADISTTATEFTLNTNCSLTVGKVYAITFERSGSLSDVDWYTVTVQTTGNPYASGTFYKDVGAGWTNSGLSDYDIYFSTAYGQLSASTRSSASTRTNASTRSAVA